MVPTTGPRRLHVRVKTAKGRTPSSRDWLARQLNDPYVAAAASEGWRSRSAFKLIQLDDRFGLLKKGDKVVDLGAAPGGWSRRSPPAGSAPPRESAGGGDRCARHRADRRCNHSEGRIFSMPTPPPPCARRWAVMRPISSSPTWPPTPPAIARLTI